MRTPPAFPLDGITWWVEPHTDTPPVLKAGVGRAFATWRLDPNSTLSDLADTVEHITNWLRDHWNETIW
jgi:hypothetical protein